MKKKKEWEPADYETEFKFSGRSLFSLKKICFAVDARYIRIEEAISGKKSGFFPPREEEKKERCVRDSRDVVVAFSSILRLVTPVCFKGNAFQLFELVVSALESFDLVVLSGLGEQQAGSSL